MDKKSEVTEKQKAFESCMKSFRPDIENYSNQYYTRRMIQQFLPKQNNFCHTPRRNRKLVSELKLNTEKINVQLRNI